MTQEATDEPRIGLALSGVFLALQCIMMALPMMTM